MAKPKQPAIYYTRNLSSNFSSPISSQLVLLSSTKIRNSFESTSTRSGRSFIHILCSRRPTRISKKIENLHQDKKNVTDTIFSILQQKKKFASLHLNLLIAAHSMLRCLYLHCPSAPKPTYGLFVEVPKLNKFI